MDDLDGAVKEWLFWRRTSEGDVVDRLHKKCANPRCKKPRGTACLTCRECRTVSYCSKACQLEHWKQSKGDSAADMFQASWTLHKSRCHAIRRRKPFARILALPESGRKGLLFPADGGEPRIVDGTGRGEWNSARVRALLQCKYVQPVDCTVGELADEYTLYVNKNGMTENAPNRPAMALLGEQAGGYLFGAVLVTRS